MRAPTAQERKLFGALADDVAFLRDTGMTVAPFKGVYRVNDDTMTADGISALAKKRRADLEAAAARRSTTMMPRRRKPCSRDEAAEQPSTTASMEVPGIDALAATVARLERENALFKKLLLGAVVTRRHSLELQVSGLAEIEAELRTGEIEND